MTGAAAAPQGWMQTLLPVAVVALVLVVRMRRMGQMRRLRLEHLWILPAIFTAMVAALYWTMPPAGWGWAVCAAALAVGLAAGWWRGRMMDISVDPGSHALNHRASPAAILFLIALVAVRSGLRQAMASEGATALHLNAQTATDALLALAWGLIVAQRLEMYLRGRRLLEGAGR